MSAFSSTFANVDRLMTRYGRAATLRRRTVTDASTWPPTTQTTNYSLTICEIVSDHKPMGGEPASAEGRKVYVLSDIAIAMATDALVIDGVEHGIVMVRRLAPAGDVPLFECLARRPQ